MRPGQTVKITDGIFSGRTATIEAYCFPGLRVKVDELEIIKFSDQLEPLNQGGKMIQGKEGEQFTELEGFVEPKPGPKTSEFYVVIGGALLSIAVGGGWLSTDQAQAVTDATTQTVTAVTHLATTLAPLVAAIAYTWSRTRIKAG